MYCLVDKELSNLYWYVVVNIWKRQRRQMMCENDADKKNI